MLPNKCYNACSCESHITMLSGDLHLASHHCPHKHTLPRHSFRLILMYNYCLKCPGQTIQSMPFSFSIFLSTFFSLSLLYSFSSLFSTLFRLSSFLPPLLIAFSSPISVLFFHFALPLFSTFCFLHFSLLFTFPFPYSPFSLLFPSFVLRLRCKQLPPITSFFHCSAFSRKSCSISLADQSMPDRCIGQQR